MPDQPLRGLHRHEVLVRLRPRNSRRDPEPEQSGVRMSDERIILNLADAQIKALNELGYTYNRPQETSMSNEQNKSRYEQALDDEDAEIDAGERPGILDDLEHDPSTASVALIYAGTAGLNGEIIDLAVAQLRNEAKGSLLGDIMIHAHGLPAHINLVKLPDENNGTPIYATHGGHKWRAIDTFPRGVAMVHAFGQVAVIYGIRGPQWKLEPAASAHR